MTTTTDSMAGPIKTALVVWTFSTFAVLAILAAGILYQADSIGFFEDMLDKLFDYDYFDFLRAAVSIYACIGAIVLLLFGRSSVISWALVAMAGIYNPVDHLHFSSGVWTAMNIASCFIIVSANRPLFPYFQSVVASCVHVITW